MSPVLNQPSSKADAFASGLSKYSRKSWMPRVALSQSSPVSPSAHSAPVSRSTTANSYPGVTRPMDRSGSWSAGRPLVAWMTVSVMPYAA